MAKSYNSRLQLKKKTLFAFQSAARPQKGLSTDPTTTSVIMTSNFDMAALARKK